jgi:hypothetical protein
VRRPAGHIRGFSAFLARFVDGDLSVIVLTNCDHFDLAPLVRDLADQVLGHRRLRAVAAECDPALLGRAAGAYGPGGADATVEVRGVGLDLRSPLLSAHLVPVGGSSFQAADDADTEVRFEGGRMVIQQPFGWTLATRTPG